MRILLTYVTVGRGGDAVQVLALAEAFRRRGHQVSLVGAHTLSPYTFDTVGGRVLSLARRLPWWARDLLEVGFGLRATWRAARAVRRQDIDLVVHRASAYDVGVANLARRLRRPLILYLDAHLEAERAFRGEGFWRRPHRGAMMALGGAATVIATPSRAVADYCVGLGLAAEKIAIVRNGISERHLRMGLEVARAHPPLADPLRCTIGYVGSLARWHGVDLLLDAVADLRARPHADGAPAEAPRTCRLVIVGRGAEYEALRVRARSLGLGEAVDWRGPLPHDEAVRAIGEFDIAVLPNTLPTGAPMKLAEYAALARPIVAPDYPNIRDLYADGREIVLVPPGDHRALARAIRSLAADPSLARRMGRASRARVEAYTWEKAVDILLSRILD